MLCPQITLAPCVWPQSHPSLIRDRIGTWAERAPGYDVGYDFSTLFYDAYWCADVGAARLIAPKLLNFQGLLQDAHITLDGVEARYQITEFPRSSRIDLFCDQRPETLKISHPLAIFEGPIGGDLRAMFAGRNAIVTVAKDQRIEWLIDWVRYHVTTHGADAVVIYDNGSTQVTSDQMREALASIQGLKISAVIDAAFPFGPTGNSHSQFKSRFFQLAMLEHARARLLEQARAVLNLDIDELVWSVNGTSVFEAAARRGYVRLGGLWVYAPHPSAPPKHHDHTCTIPGGGPRTSSKWCVAPQSEIGQTPWFLHRIGPRTLPVAEDFGFWHCRQLSTNWDYDRQRADPRAIQPIPELTAALSAMVAA